MARRALLVGIDKYDVLHDLTTCVADATDMETLLERHADASPNYSCRLMTYGKEEKTIKVTATRLREALRELFNYTGDVLFYFSGHGAITKVGGYISTCESEPDNWGIPMQEIIDWANSSPARRR